jgi:hypothetical protein
MHTGCIRDAYGMHMGRRMRVVRWRMRWTGPGAVAIIQGLLIPNALMSLRHCSGAVAIVVCGRVETGARSDVAL